MTMYSSSKILFLRNCKTLLISLILLNGILLSTSESVSLKSADKGVFLSALVSS